METNIKKNDDVLDVVIKGVRISYPNLFTPVRNKKFENSKPKLSCNFLLDKENYDKLSKAFVALAKGVNKSVSELGDIEKRYRRLRNDGDADYSSKYYLISSSTPEYPPVYIDETGKGVADPIAAGAEQKLYPGCEVNVRLRVKAVKSEYGTIIYVGVEGIQFSDHAERLGGGGASKEDIESAFEANTTGDFDNDEEWEDEDF